MRSLSRSSILFLTWWITPYRIPLFDELYRRLGDKFLVVSHKIQTTINNQSAADAGEFPRLLLSGRHIELNRRFIDGKGTPLGFTFTPGLLFTLLRIRPKLVISINFSAWTLLCMLIRVPTVIFWEGTQHTERTVGKWRVLLRRWMVRQALAFIVNGKLARRYLEALGAAAEDIFEGGLSPLVPPYNSSMGVAREETRTRLRFLFVSRLSPLP